MSHTGTRDFKLGFIHRILGWSTSIVLGLGCSLGAGCVPLDAQAPACLAPEECASGYRCVDRICVAELDMSSDRAVLPDVHDPTWDCEMPLPCTLADATGACAAGTSDCIGRCMPAQPRPAVEVCDDIDNDCDGIDDFEDEDIRGHGDPCEAAAAIGSCRQGTMMRLGQRCLA